jgi:succinoglycan biosynthesis protein ExoM
MRVLVATLTFRRPDDLAAILPLLVEQAAGSPDDVEILVVDNDPEAGARDAVLAFAQDHPIVTYEHAPVPGIAAARNVALASASGHDVLVFIDDDERPIEGWLDYLLATYREFHSAAVVGPVISRFDVDPDNWIVSGGFFNRRRLKTGTAVDLVATNNLLLDVEQIRQRDLTFDERFGLSGGSDTLFARLLHRSHGVMIWCDEAIVYDIVPASRSTRSWVVRRAFRSGNTWMRTSLQMSETTRERATVRIGLAARGLARVLAGSGRIALGALTGRIDHRARGTRTVARGAGLVAGAVGTVYSEYKRN